MTVVSEHTWGPGTRCKGPRRRARPSRGSERTPKAVLLQSCTLAGAPHGDAERSSGKLRRLVSAGVRSHGVLSDPFSLRPLKRPVKETGSSCGP